MHTSAYIVLSRACPGQRLAEAVLDQHGMVLLPAGACLTESHLQHFHDHGISILSVETESASPMPDAQQLQRRLQTIFSTAGQSEAALQLRLAIQHYRSRA